MKCPIPQIVQCRSDITLALSYFYSVKQGDWLKLHTMCSS